MIARVKDEVGESGDEDKESEVEEVRKGWEVEVINEGDRDEKICASLRFGPKENCIKINKTTLGHKNKNRA